MQSNAFFSLAGIVVMATATAAQAVGPFTEDFNSGTANWRQNISATSVIFNASGGPDSSAYVGSDFAFFPNPPQPQVALFRGHDGFDASGDAFVGDWLAANIVRLSAYVKHIAPQSLDFFLRLAKTANSPAVGFTLPQQVPAGVWTRLDFDISFSNPLHQNEGAPTQAFYDDVLKNIGNVQIGVIIPAALANDATMYRYDLDNVSIVPEPTSIALVVMGVAASALARRRSR